MQVRLAKVERMRAGGIDPYPVGYPRTHTIAEVRTEFGDCRPTRPPASGSAWPGA